MTGKVEKDAEKNQPVEIDEDRLDAAQGGAGIVAAPVAPLKSPVVKGYTCSGGTCE
ncbi:MAG: hypothetical protein IPN84_01500 [Sphingomonadales bacterium]|jgi:hypothetical protein|nr:hypothetical protein [Sphingomonadales bacterium]